MAAEGKQKWGGVDKPILGHITKRRRACDRWAGEAGRRKVTLLRKCFLPGSQNSEKFIELEHVWWNCARPVFPVLDLDLHFERQSFVIFVVLQIANIS